MTIFTITHVSLVGSLLRPYNAQQLTDKARQ